MSNVCQILFDTDPMEIGSVPRERLVILESEGSPPAVVDMLDLFRMVFVGMPSAVSDCNAGSLSAMQKDELQRNMGIYLQKHPDDQAAVRAWEDAFREDGEADLPPAPPQLSRT